MNEKNTNTKPERSSGNEVGCNDLLAKRNPFLAVTTYLIYILLWEGLLIGGCSYVVFWRGESGWWFALAVLLSGSAYAPKKWAELF